MYASKRRQRNFKRVREPTKPSTTSNPSKRHRERLNGELETVAQLLPYDHQTISRLDKLSVLRLAVSFLQAKAHFQACHHQTSTYMGQFPLATHNYSFVARPALPYSSTIPTVFHPPVGHALIDPKEPDFETISMKALGGFLLIINDNGEIYYASENVEQFLGFHQSDILHQPLFDLIHSEDRDDIRQQLDVTFGLPPTTTTSLTHQEIFLPENLCYLERNVNARFRCLLDNTCGFLRIDMRGKLMAIHGLPSSYVLGRSTTGPVLGLAVVCTPFVPPTSESPPEDMILKTKHHLDGALVSMDEKVHAMLELSENELPMSFYQLIHVEDAFCLAEAHKEVLKNGSSGLLIYRLISSKSKRTYFVQSSCRMFYKNGKPESIGLTHRLLNEVEGTMLLEKRSSLKAKLLSFDDSYLQSPRNLQSAAALPIPATKEEFPDDDSFNFTSNINQPNSNLRTKKQRDDQLAVSIATPTALVPKIPNEQWHFIQPPVMSEFATALPFPHHLHPAVDQHGWNSNDMWNNQEIYSYPAPQRNIPIANPTYPVVSTVQTSVPSMQLHPLHGYTDLDYQWHANQSISMQPTSTSLQDMPNDMTTSATVYSHKIDPRYGYLEYGKAPITNYPAISAVLSANTSSTGFNLISEVTNTLLGQ
ncbi:unnamed protein product [Auanema sp. JU1783]|nr:unnamed protein product [Auanema sp. JU1783]